MKIDNILLVLILCLLAIGAIEAGIAVSRIQTTQNILVEQKLTLDDIIKDCRENNGILKFLLRECDTACDDCNKK